MANVTFHVGSTAPPSTGLTTGGLYVDNTNGGIWYATSNDSRTEVGSWVKYTKTVTSTSGTKLGTITINGVSTDIHQDDSKGCSFNTSKKIYLIGTATQSATTDTGLQTYSHDTAYVGTDGCLYSNKSKCITVATETKNTAGGTATNEKLFFVGMKSDNVDNAQTYTNSYCYAQGNHLYSNQLKCANICYADIEIAVPHLGNSALPVEKGKAASYYTNVSEDNLNGAFIGYDYQDFTSGYSLGTWSHTRLGVQVGSTASGGTPTYKIGMKLTANSTLSDRVEAISEGSLKLRVYYIPF